MKKISIISLLAATAIFGASVEFRDANSNFNRINPAIDQNSILSYNSSIQRAKKAVVNISTTRTTKTKNHLNSLMNDPFFQEFFGFRFNIPEQRSQKSSSLGSGVIITSNGYIVTNYHVIEDSDEIIVSMLDNSKEYKAKVVGSDPKTDLAIIKIEAKNLTPAYFADSSKLLEGDVVFAIGNPFGVGGSITSGIISGLNKDNIGLNQYEDFIQTDASINPGNSGGALIDSRGALVGINSAILSRSGGNNGIGFAIPSNMVKTIAQKLISDGKITRGYIGVMIANLTTDQKEIYKNKEGALITNVEKDYPASKAGLQRGDLIIKVDNKPIKSANDLKNIIGAYSPNTKISVEYERAGKIYSTKLQLTTTDDVQVSAQNFSIDGLSVQNLSDDIRYKYKIPQDIKGVLITDVKDGSNAANTGFETGDIIIQVNEKIISNINEFSKELQASKASNRKPIIWINRAGILMGLVLK